MTNFYASWDLAEVTTIINLITLVCSQSGLNMVNEDAGYSRQQFEQLVSNVFRAVDLLDKWIVSDSHSDTTCEIHDSVFNFHKGLFFLHLFVLHIIHTRFALLWTSHASTEIYVAARRW